MTEGLDPEVLADIVAVEDARRLFGALGKPVEFWEMLCVVKVDRELVREEVKRLTDLLDAGHAAGVARVILDHLKRLREQIGPLVKGVREFFAMIPDAPQDSELTEMLLGFISISPRGREAASRWVAQPARFVGEARGKVQTIIDVVGRYREAVRQLRPSIASMEEVEFAPPTPLGTPTAAALEPATFGPAPADGDPPTRAPMTAVRFEPADAAGVARPGVVDPFGAGAAASAPAPKTRELPPGVDAEVLEDVRRVEQCRKIFEVTHQQIEVWEVFCLVMLESSTRETMDKLLALRDAGDMDKFADGALELFEKLLDMRSKYGRFVRRLRDYIAKLPIGHFGLETMEMALGFIVASSRGRQTAQQWIDEPDRHKQEAAGRLEDIISRTINYQTALRVAS